MDSRRHSLTAALPGVGGVYSIAERKMRRQFDAPLMTLRAPSPPDLAEGARMAKIVGCSAGCHGMEGGGGEESIEGIITHTAPTLSAVLPLHNDEELVRLVRFGVKRDGRSAVGMISFVFWSSSDQDLANIIAHPRAPPELPPVPRVLELPFRGRLALAVLAAYQPDQFRHLLRTGEPIGGRDLGIMSWSTRVAFSLFTDEEIADLYVFLKQHYDL